MEKNKFYQFIEKYNSLILLVLMVATGGINYLFQIVIGRNLTMEEYGTVNSLLSFTSILSVPGTILAMIISKQIATALARGNDREIKSTARILIVFTILIGIILMFIEILFSGMIGRSIHVENRQFVLLCCMISGLTIMLQAFEGTIQGMQKFFEYGFQSFITAVSKIVLAVLLIRIGWNVGGALAGMLLAQIITMLYCIDVLYRLFKKTEYSRVDVKKILAGCMQDLPIIAIGQLNISILSNCDLILVKRYFNETDAGIYSAAIIIARLVMYVSTMLIYILFPKAAKRSAAGENTKGLFIKSLLANLLIIIAGCIGIRLFGKWVICLFLGENYLQSFDMIQMALVYIIPVSIFTIITNYVSATPGVRFFLISSTAGTLLIVAAAAVFHETIQGMLLIMGMLLCVVCLLNIGYILLKKH